MSDLTEETMIEMLTQMRAKNAARMSMRATHLLISGDGIERARQMAAENPEFRKRVQEHFPQLVSLL